MKDASKTFSFENDEQYRTTINPVGDYVDQNTYVLSKKLNVDKDIINGYIKEIIRNNETGKIRNPKVKFLERSLKGDKEEKQTTLLGYIKDSLSQGDVLAPSFTAYFNPKIKKSLIGDYAEANKSDRKVAKGKMLHYESKSDPVMTKFWDDIQKTKKIFNNGLSGAFLSPFNALYNPTAHYTLTSTTMSVTSLSNSLTEAMLANNKHYRNPDIVISNITSMIRLTDRDLVFKAMNTYNLHVPSADELFEKILSSTKRYWRDVRQEEYIRDLLRNLDNIDRVIVAYVNNLSNVKDFNDNLMRSLITNMSKKVTGLSKDPKKDMKELPSYLVNLLHHIFYDDLKGEEINYDNFLESGLLEKMASTGINITEIFDRFKLLFDAFFITDNAPFSVAYIPDMQREVIVLSDTDSTCATYQLWIEWFFGELTLSGESVAVTASVMTIVTQALKHQLAKLTMNMNAGIEMIGKLSMKNEFYWPVLVTAPVAKHYYAGVGIKEGVVFDKLKSEIKGVNLIASKIPAFLREKAEAMMMSIINTIVDGKKIDLYKYVKEIADIEILIKDSINKGSTTFLGTEVIENSEKRKLGDASPDRFADRLWREVFMDKYGLVSEPPYVAVRLASNVGTKGKFKDMINDIKDEEIKIKFRDFMEKEGKEFIATFRLPQGILEQKGIPEELQEAIDTKKVILNLMSVFYYIADSIGFFRKDKLTLSETIY